MDSSLRRRRGLSRLIGLAGLAACALLIVPAGAQQVIAGKGSVTIDLGVLNQPGQPVTGGYAPNGQASTYPQTISGQPTYGPPYGSLLSPPPQYPVSTLTVQPPVGSVPYVPPASTASMPAAPASTGSAASTSVTTPAATASTTGTPPPPTPSATTMPMGTDTATTETVTTIGAATTTAETSTDTGSSAATTVTTPAVPEPAPLTATETTGTATTTAGTTAATDTSSTAAIQPVAPAATGTEGGTATTGATSTTIAATTSTPTGATGQTQSASIPPAALSEGQIRIAFPADSAEIPDAVKAELDALALKMASDDNMRVQLLAYASGTPETASQARRMSLSRALAVRSYLIKQGVGGTRMDVRALGNNVESSPADRVDIIPKAQ